MSKLNLWHTIQVWNTKRENKKLQDFSGNRFLVNLNPKCITVSNDFSDTTFIDFTELICNYANLFLAYNYASYNRYNSKFGFIPNQLKICLLKFYLNVFIQLVLKYIRFLYLSTNWVTHLNNILSGVIIVQSKQLELDRCYQIWYVGIFSLYLGEHVYIFLKFKE